ncbi:MAG: glycosyltransferase family 2 protein [Planctomycetes bacterium]|nr:glycosyltransferase family 2 protein [Planctomycetota bacterium]
MPTVSVIIPTYNRSKLLKEAIESVLKQNYTDFEILVIDDGSSDNTRSVVEQIPDKRVKYYYKENGGQSSARNFGVVKSHSQYVAFLDHDDLWPDSNYLTTMIKHIQSQDEYGVAYARVTQLDKGIALPFAREQRYKSGWLTKAFFKGGPCIMPSATLFKKECIKGWYFDELLTTGEDNDAFLRLSTQTPFVFVGETSVIRREVENSQSENITVDQLCNGILSFERFCYQLGGDKYASKFEIRRTLSHKYRRAGKVSFKEKRRRASMVFFKKGIIYYPFDFRLYFDLLKAWILLSKKNDEFSNWQMPKPLPKKITVSLNKD